MAERRVWEKVQNTYSELHFVVFSVVHTKLCSGGKLARIKNGTLLVNCRKVQCAVAVEVHMQRCRLDNTGLFCLSLQHNETDCNVMPLSRSQIGYII